MLSWCEFSGFSVLSGFFCLKKIEVQQLSELLLRHRTDDCVVAIGNTVGPSNTPYSCRPDSAASLTTTMNEAILLAVMPDK